MRSFDSPHERNAATPGTPGSGDPQRSREDQLHSRNADGSQAEDRRSEEGSSQPNHDEWRWAMFDVNVPDRLLPRLLENLASGKLIASSNLDSTIETLADAAPSSEEPVVRRAQTDKDPSTKVPSGRRHTDPARHSTISRRSAISGGLAACFGLAAAGYAWSRRPVSEHEILRAAASWLRRPWDSEQWIHPVPTERLALLPDIIKFPPYAYAPLETDLSRQATAFQFRVAGAVAMLLSVPTPRGLGCLPVTPWQLGVDDAWKQTAIWRSQPNAVQVAVFSNPAQCRLMMSPARFT